MNLERVEFTLDSEDRAAVLPPRYQAPTPTVTEADLDDTERVINAFSQSWGEADVAHHFRMA